MNSMEPIREGLVNFGQAIGRGAENVSKTLKKDCVQQYFPFSPTNLKLEGTKAHKALTIISGTVVGLTLPISIFTFSAAMAILNYKAKREFKALKQEMEKVREMDKNIVIPETTRKILEGEIKHPTVKQLNQANVTMKLLINHPDLRKYPEDESKFDVSRIFKEGFEEGKVNFEEDIAEGLLNLVNELGLKTDIETAATIGLFDKDENGVFKHIELIQENMSEKSLNLLAGKKKPFTKQDYETASAELNNAINALINKLEI